MSGCKRIREMIDEAEKPDLLSYEAAEHIALCAGCRDFAVERASLRQLIGSSARVQAPANFDVVLSERLATATSARRFSLRRFSLSNLNWISPAGYMRLAAATAGLVVMIAAAQYGGLFSGPGSMAPSDLAKTPEAPSAPQLVPRATPPPAAVPAAGALNAGAIKRATRFDERRVRRATPEAFASAQGLRAAESAVVLVRGQNGEREVSVPTVSVGAQPLLYVNTNQPVTRNVRASF